ncbi:MAG: FKBP-type peptidyl-prolyl cis-trans isomerase [Bacteroidales bacterium]|nr:FKBP-type peptidyl-prolyl cis-trans isomerase [Bacteroidales bacterium]
MKTIKLFAVCVMAAAVAVACVSSPKVNPQPKGISKSAIDSVSYAFGVWAGQTAYNTQLGDLNMSQVMKGYLDAIKQDEKANPDMAGSVLNDFLMKKNEIMAEVNLAEGTEFLVKNAKKAGVVTTESGLQYEIVRNGNGVKPTSVMDLVEVNYEGKTLDGKVFDSSYERGEPVSFNLNQVISGWSEGLQYIDEGGEIMLYIPSELGYGANGPMGPNQLLIFRVELLKVTHADVEPEVAE